MRTVLKPLTANPCRRMEAEAETQAIADKKPVDEDEQAGFDLGDSIYIEGGRLDSTRGRIYYMDDDLIRILPDCGP